ncbi:MAG: hypothetical protein LKK19_07405, partial [Bacteroidales bacterium]|nr:hypothetical protein [Bacteroidales bacterium]
MSKRKRYIYNKDELKFEEYRVSPKKVVSTVLKVFLYCSGAALALYLLLTFVLDTPSEKKLRRENKYIGRTYDEMVERADMLHNTVQSLEYRDKGIYEQIFNSEPPDFM